MAGDSLARGDRSAQFPASNGVSQERWDAIFGAAKISFVHCSDCWIAMPEQDKENPNRHAVNCKKFRKQKRTEYFPV